MHGHRTHRLLLADTNNKTAKDMHRYDELFGSQYHWYKKKEKDVGSCGSTSISICLFVFFLVNASINLFWEENDDEAETNDRHES